MPQSIRPGDVLADRYTLVDLLSESSGGRFFCAEDQVLDRRVALHVIATDDERAPGLMEAARHCATVVDRRILRVLDADESSGLSYVVNEWGDGSSLDRLVADEGPLSPRRAAWITAEVADTLRAAHDVRVPHGHLVPENVLIDRNGQVRLIGFCVDAALTGLPSGGITEDVTNLGGLLYFLLTGRWPGPGRSGCPDAPTSHGRVLRARQVRAGMPRVLDSLCDQVINPFGASPMDTAHNTLTARGICELLREFVGDPTGLAVPPENGPSVPMGVAAPPSRPPQPRAEAAPAVEPEPELEPEPEVAPEAEPTTQIPAAEAADAGPSDEVTGDATGDATGEATGEANVGAPGDEAEGAPYGEGRTVDVPGPLPPPAVGDGEVTGRVSPVDTPTQLGMPIFDDDGDDVTWLTARSGTPAPPPPLEDPPERPLFATDQARKPRPGSKGDAKPEYWPWDTAAGGTGSGVIPVAHDEEDDGPVPGRSWLRLAALVSAALLLMVAIVIAYNLGRGKTPLGAERGDEPTSSTSPTPDAQPQPIGGVTATDLDPQAVPPEENPDMAPNAVDGDPGTGWLTSTYTDQLGPPPGLKTGVGMVLDLHGSHDVTGVQLQLAGAPTSITIFASDSEPTKVAGLEEVDRFEATKPKVRRTFDEPVSASYLVVWFTALPQVDGGFRGELDEAVVTE